LIHGQAEFPVFAVFPAVVFEGTASFGWAPTDVGRVSAGFRQVPPVLDIAEKPLLSATQEVSALSALSAGQL
jgi:hypothetical protein